MKYKRALEYVESLGEFSYDFDLTRIKSFLEKLDNPQDKIKIIHVAGTNGKGSVCAYISAILRKAGYKAGLYTSPHLLDIRERVQLNGKKIPEKDFAGFAGRYSSLAGLHSLTYFEFLTALAFWYFEREKVDFAVIETGLGGRLDATNIIKNPAVSVITNVSLEHTRYLGSTVSEIAKEKAGIIKNDGIVVTAAAGDAMRAIIKAAKIKNAKIVPVRSGLKKYKKYRTSLFGVHQIENANISAAVCRLLNVPQKFIVAGLKSTVWPGRFEIKKYFKPSRFTAVLDCAHNPSGVAALVDSVKKYFGKKINFAVGILKDKDYKKMIRIAAPSVDSVFISAPLNKRALPPRFVKKEFSRYIPGKKIYVFNSIKRAVDSASKRSENFCVTGSMYTVAEAMKCLKI